MAPHTITHCINDDTSFLCESRDIKYPISMNIKFLCFPRGVTINRTGPVPSQKWLIISLWRLLWVELRLNREPLVLGLQLQSNIDRCG